MSMPLSRQATFKIWDMQEAQGPQNETISGSNRDEQQQQPTKLPPIRQALLLPLCLWNYSGQLVRLAETMDVNEHA